MKKIFLMVAIAIMGYSATFAQDSLKRKRMTPQQPKATAEQRAQKFADNMQSQLKLDAAQKDKVYRLQLTKIKDWDVKRNQHLETRKKKMAENKVEQDKYQKQLGEILNAEQKTKLESLKAERVSKMKQGVERHKMKRNQMRKNLKKTQESQPANG